MKAVARNIAAPIVGLVLGSVANLALVTIGGHVIPPPPGADVSDMEKLRASMHLFEPKHFIFPFLAHALGALAGGFVASLVAATHRKTFALAVSLFFLVGGIVNCFLLPAPFWFMALDVVAAYIPMGWLAGLLAEKVRPAGVSTVRAV